MLFRSISETVELKCGRIVNLIIFYGYNEKTDIPEQKEEPGKQNDTTN